MSVIRAVMAGAALAAVAFGAQATSITVLNPSFETVPVGGFPETGGCSGTGCQYNSGSIPDWTLSDPGDSGEWQPGNSTSFFNPPGAEDGTTVAYTNGGAISQTVTPLSVAGETYTLTVWVGDRADVGTSGDFVDLVIGGTDYAAAPVDGGSLTSGQWTEFQAVAVASASGDTIGIQMGSSGVQGDFDNVSLSAVVPEPGTWALMLAGFAGLGAMLRARRKTTNAVA
jgi:hypothetical protein